MLFPVVHFKSELNRTDDGHWPPWDVKTSMEHWILAADTSRPYLWAPDYQLYEGWYNIHVSDSSDVHMHVTHGEMLVHVLHLIASCSLADNVHELDASSAAAVDHQVSHAQVPCW
jgi:hypothetical protein